MIASGIAVRRRGRDLWAAASRVLLLLAVAALAYLAVRIVLAVAGGQFAIVASEVSPWSLALAAAIYLASHGLRILRLALLIGGWQVGLRVIASFHLMTAAVSLAAPLKLGEIYRVLELSNLVGSLVRAIVIVWWERAFDVALILLILTVALARDSGGWPPQFLAVMALAIGFILVTVLIVFVVPDNLRRLSVLVIRRYDSRRTVPLLRLLDVVRRAILEAPMVVERKIPSLVTLTVLIWVLEITCFAILFPGLTLASASDALLSFLSAVTRGETLLGVLDAGTSSGFGASVMAYLAATQIPLVFVGLVAAVHYVAYRLRRSA